jgi:hypothetical protein
VYSDRPTIVIFVSPGMTVSIIFVSPGMTVSIIFVSPGMTVRLFSSARA